MNDHLKVAIVPVMPFVTKMEDGQEPEGMVIGLVKLISRSLNFTFDFIGDSRSEFGARNVNGTGQVAKLQRREVDMLCPYANTPDFTIDIRPSKSYTKPVGKMLGAVGRADATNFAAFLTTFDKEIWLYYVNLILITVVLSALSDSLLMHRVLTKSKLFKEVTKYAWMYLSASFCEGSFKVPVSRRSQFLLGIWLIAILTLTTALFGQFKALLMYRIEEKRIETVSDLALRPDLLPFVAVETVYDNMFRKSTDKDYIKVWQHALRHREESLITVAMTGNRSMFQRIKNGDGILFSEPMSIMSSLKDCCQELSGNKRFYFSEHGLFSFHVGCGLRLDVPEYWAKLFDTRIQWITETGIMWKLLEDTAWDYAKCEEIQDDLEISVKFEKVAPVLYFVLGIHAFAAFFVLPIEIILKRYFHQQ